MSNKKISLRFYVFAVLLIASILLGACAAPTPIPTEVVEIPTAEPTAEPTPVTSNLETISQADLVGVTWQWTGGRESPTAEAMTVADPGSYTLTFGDDGSLFIQADCNTSRATYELSGDQLTIGPGATTMMACPPGSLSDQFLAELSQATQVGTAYGNLVIVLDTGAEMFFQRAPAINLGADLTPVAQAELIDTLWQWTSLVETQPMADTTIDDPENYNIVFREDGTYSAKADCNVLNGSYELVGSQLTIQPGITTLAECAPDSKYDLYASLLARVTGAGTRDGTLVLLLDDSTAAMSYENAGESPVPTPMAAVAGDPATILGTPDGVENFNNTNNWTNFSNACFTSEVTGGQFVMTANGQAQSACWEFSWPQLGNFYIETTQQMPESCDPQDRFGMIFRSPDNNRGYLYGFDCAGQYSLTIWNGEGTTVLVAPTANAAIDSNPGAVNVMGLMAFEENISLYVNGVYLQTVSDYTYLDKGRIGYFVRAATENPFTVSYDQLRVWVLEDELYPPDLATPLPPVAIVPPSGSAASGEARVNVNVRTGPSMLFPILGTAPQGTVGQILGISPDGSWYAISVPTTRVGTGIAWAAADFVTLTNTTGQPLPVITPPLLPTTVSFPAPPQFAPQVVMREPATLRSGPTLEYPVFGVAPTGSRAEVLGESQDGEWWAVRLPTSLASGGSGWVPKVFTVASNIPANLPVIPTPALPNNISPAAPASGAPSLITREPLNVRSGPGNAYPSLGMVPLGTVMAVVGVSPDGENYVVNVPIEVNSAGTGWVAARFVSAQNVSNVPVVQPPPVP